MAAAAAAACQLAHERPHGTTETYKGLMFDFLIMSERAACESDSNHIECRRAAMPEQPASDSNSFRHTIMLLVKSSAARQRRCRAHEASRGVCLLRSSLGMQRLSKRKCLHASSGKLRGCVRICGSGAFWIRLLLGRIGLRAAASGRTCGERSCESSRPLHDLLQASSDMPCKLALTFDRDTLASLKVENSASGACAVRRRVASWPRVGSGACMLIRVSSVTSHAGSSEAPSRPAYLIMYPRMRMPRAALCYKCAHAQYASATTNHAGATLQRMRASTAARITWDSEGHSDAHLGSVLHGRVLHSAVLGLGCLPLLLA